MTTQQFVMTQGDTAPGLIIVLYDRSQGVSIGTGIGLSVTMNNSVTFPTVAPTVTGALDLSSSDVSVLCQFRRNDSQTNIFSVYAQKIGTGATGGIYLQWPFFSTDVDVGNYEIECIVFWGIRNQTCYDRIPIWIEEQYGPGALIADDQNASWIGGNLYIRNTDTGTVHGISVSGSVSSITVQDGVNINTLQNPYPMPPTYTQAQPDIDSTEYPYTPFPGDYTRPTQPVSLISVRIADGQLYFLNPSDNFWHRVYLTGNPSLLTIDDAIRTFNSGNADIVTVTTRQGRLLMKNLDNQTWHEITITGTPGAENLTVGDAE